MNPAHEAAMQAEAARENCERLLEAARERPVTDDPSIENLAAQLKEVRLAAQRLAYGLELMAMAMGRMTDALQRAEAEDGRRGRA